MGAQVDENGSPDDSSQFNSDDSGNNASALSSAATPMSNVDLGSLHQENHQRYVASQDTMSKLQQEYANLSGQNAQAYTDQRKMLQDATERLNSLSFGPSQKEINLRSLAALVNPPGVSGVNMASYNNERAELMKEQREGELQKAQLMTQYGLQAPAATLQANNSRIGQLEAMMRIYGSQVNNSAMAGERGNQALPWYVKSDGNGNFYLPPGAQNIMDTQAMSKLFGRFALVPQADGSKRIVAGASIANSAPQPGGSSSPSPGTQAPRAVAPVAPSSNGAGNPSGATSTPHQGAPQGAATDAWLSDLFQPSSVLDPKYGSLTQQTKPAYVKTAQQAFDPNYFQNYQWKTDWVTGTPAIYKQALEAGTKEMGDLAQGSNDTIRNYGQALQALDSLGNDKKLLTGTFGDKQAAFENFVRGISPDLAASLTGDKNLQSLAARQDADKYFLQAATTGLKAIYGGRITNMEVQQRMKSLPSSNIMPSVARMLADANAAVAQDGANKANLWGAYIQRGGNPNMAKFNTWYNANFSPFSTDSRLKNNLTAMTQRQPTQLNLPDDIKKKYGLQ